MTDNAMTTPLSDTPQHEFDEDDLPPDETCTHCCGTGADPLDDISPCPDCDGEGYRWWE